MKHYGNNTPCPNTVAFSVSEKARKLNEETIQLAKKVVAYGEFDMDELDIEEP